MPRFDSPAVDLLVRFHLAMVAFSADDLADLHAHAFGRLPAIAAMLADVGPEELG